MPLSTSATGSMTRRAPKRSTSRPTDCMPTIAPAANASSAKLSSPSLVAPIACFTAGIRDVHAPRITP